MRGWWQEITGLVLPVACAGCGRPRTVLCDGCTRSLHGRPAVRVRPEPEPAGLPAVWAAAPYADAVRAVLLAHKERGALALATPLGVALAGAAHAAAGGCVVRGAVAAGGGDVAWAAEGCRALGGGVGESRAVRAVGAYCGDAYGVGAVRGGSEGRGVGAVVEAEGGGGVGVGALPLVLVPVPSARRAVRARGHDAVRRVAVAAARELRRGGTAARVAPVLRQRRKVADQAGLDARQRHENLAGALEVVPGGMRLLEGACVVLVDDLMTTGASLTEAARALYEAGAARVAAAGAAPPGVEWPSGPAEAGSAGAGQVWTGSAEAGHARTGTGAGPAGACGPAESPGAVGAVGGGCRIADGGEGRAFGGNGGESRRVHGTFGAAYTPFGPGRGELPRGDHGAVLIGAAVVAASPKAFGINRN